MHDKRLQLEDHDEQLSSAVNVDARSARVACDAAAWPAELGDS